jgi:hypothetical protein
VPRQAGHVVACTTITPADVIHQPNGAAPHWRGFERFTPRRCLIRDPPIRMPDQMPPFPRGVTRAERLGSNLVDVIAAGLLPAHDFPRALDGVRVVDAFAVVGHSEHGSPREDAEAGR